MIFETFSRLQLVVLLLLCHSNPRAKSTFSISLRMRIFFLSTTWWFGQFLNHGSLDDACHVELKRSRWALHIRNNPVCLSFSVFQMSIGGVWFGFFVYRWHLSLILRKGDLPWRQWWRGNTQSIFISIYTECELLVKRFRYLEWYMIVLRACLALALLHMVGLPSSILWKLWTLRFK